MSCCNFPSTPQHPLPLNINPIKLPFQTLTLCIYVFISVKAMVYVVCTLSHTVLPSQRLRKEIKWQIWGSDNFYKSLQNAISTQSNSHCLNLNYTSLLYLDKTCFPTSFPIFSQKFLTPIYYHIHVLSIFPSQKFSEFLIRIYTIYIPLVIGW